MRDTNSAKEVCILISLLLALASAGDGLRAQTPVETPPPGGLKAFAAGVFSAEPSSTEGGLTLLLPTGAQGVGLGRAMTAMRGQEAVFWNPAGIARLEGGHFTVYRGNHLAGEATAVSVIIARQPLGALGVSYQLLDLGVQDLRDGEGNVLGSVSFRDHLAIVSFGTQVFSWLESGVNFKMFQSRITCRGDCPDGGVTGTTYAVDAGILSTPLPALPLRVGAMIAHGGPELQLINVEQADPLPTRLRFAVAYEILHDFMEAPGLELWLTGELEDRWRNLGSPSLYLGSEFLAGEEDQFFIRAGYGQMQAGQAAGTAVGLGMRYDRFELAMAKSLSGNSISDDSEPVHVSFGVVF
ncbi:hypothetical protein ACFL5A_01435 [Gemmatimonadota bacterium]